MLINKDYVINMNYMEYYLCNNYLNNNENISKSNHSINIVENKEKRYTTEKEILERVNLFR